MARLGYWARDAVDGAVVVAYRVEDTGARARRRLSGRLRGRRLRTVRLDRFDRSADLARELSAALQANEGGLVHVRGWERAFSGPEGPERLYRFNLLRETIFAPRTAQVWWMSEDFRNIFMRHAPDTWSFMQLRFSVAEADEYIELPPTLARIVRSQLGLRPNEQVTRKAWSSLDVLDLSFHAVGDPELAHLSSLTCIKTLFLGNTRISDTSPLSELTALKFLFLSDTRVADASPLAGLTALETLDLSGTQILDASPLSSLTALKSLLLSRTQVSDAAPLSVLKSLKTLFLDGTRVSDASPLMGLAALKSLGLSGTQVSDASPLASLTSIQFLLINNTRISEVSPFASLTALRSIDMTNTSVTDVQPLINLKALTTCKLPDGTFWYPQKEPPPAKYLPRSAGG